MIERGLREFPEEADKMMDIIIYPFGYSMVLACETFAAIDDLHEHNLWGVFPLLFENMLTFPNSVRMH